MCIYVYISLCVSVYSLVWYPILPMLSGIYCSKSIRADITKSRELLRSSVSHAPMIDISAESEWVDDMSLITIFPSNTGKGDVQNNVVDASSGNENTSMNIEIEAGPEPRPY